MSILYDLAAEYGASIVSDTDTVAATLTLKSGASGSAQPALLVSRDPMGLAVGNSTVALMSLGPTSVASGSYLNFGTGFISLTSIVLTTVANADYAIAVSVGNQQRFIPMFKAAAIVGGAAI